MRQQIATLALSLAFLALIAGCDDFKPVDLTLPSTSNPAGDADPTARAVTVAADAVKLIAAADKSAAAGLKAPRQDAFDEAITLRPVDPKYRFYKAVTFMALGLDDEPARSEAVALLQARYPNLNQKSPEFQRLYYEGLLGAMADTLVAGTISASAADFLKKDYCQNLQIYDGFLKGSKQFAIRC